VPKKRRAEVPEPIDEGVLTIYTDGSMKPSPRRGGIGIRFVWLDADGAERVWDHALPATLNATNNQMEIEAATEALKRVTSRYAPFDLSEFRKIVVRTDALYVRDHVGIAIAIWSKRQWTKREGAEVINIREWKELLTAMRYLDRTHHLRVEFEYQPGKTGPHSRAVDELAKQSADSPPTRLPKGGTVRRRTSPLSVDKGSVRMEGQVFDIRIIQSQALPAPHRGTSRYKYEVVDEGSAFYNLVDWITSTETLQRGHTYRVSVNEDQGNPRIVEVLEEIEEDLSPYLTALKNLPQPATARQVSEEMVRMGFEVSPEHVKRRLDRLYVELETVSRSRSDQVGKPFVYEAVE
jgi:ribonuclease HI